jgi:hypothetical protein
MAAQYTKFSPYYKTGLFGQFLDVYVNRAIPKNSLDIEYTIDSVYKYRPDMLAADLYGNAGLWWVFSVRNPDIIKDPVFDFYPGQVIYIPSKETLTTVLGI